MTPAPKAISGKYQRDVITQVELQTMMELRREHEKLNAVFQRWLFDIVERRKAGAVVERGSLRWEDERQQVADRTDYFYYRPRRKKPTPRPFIVKGNPC